MPSSSACRRAHFLKRAIKPIAPGQRIDMGPLTQRLGLMGYQRSGTVMEPGEFAVRGGILDLFPPGRATPVRLDFFGDTLETIKAFRGADAANDEARAEARAAARERGRRSARRREKLFRSRYVELFGGATGDDPLYEAVSAGQRYPGQEHWLPLFHEHLETLFDYLPGVPVSFDHLAEEAVTGRFEQIAEHYDARLASLEQQTFGAAPYKPVPPERMFLDDKSWAAALKAHDLKKLTPFEEVEGPHVRSWRGRAGAQLRRRAPARRRECLRRGRPPCEAAARGAPPRRCRCVDTGRARAAVDAARRSRPR